jgi:hypothetical protein
VLSEGNYTCNIERHTLGNKSLIETSRNSAAPSPGEFMHKPVMRPVLYFRRNVVAGMRGIIATEEQDAPGANIQASYF